MNAQLKNAAAKLIQKIKKRSQTATVRLADPDFGNHVQVTQGNKIYRYPLGNGSIKISRK